MGLAPSDQAFIGRHLDQNGVTLDGAADAEPDVLTFRHAVGNRDCLDRCDAHGGPHAALWPGLTRWSGSALVATDQLSSLRTIAAASHIAFNFPNAIWRGMYFMPQSGATASLSAATCCSPFRIRSATTEAGSISGLPRSSTPSMIFFEDRSLSTPRSSLGCAASIEICSAMLSSSSARNE